MDKKLNLAVLTLAVLLSACQDESWVGQKDGKNNDLSYWWPNTGTEKVVVECLSVPGKDVPMVRGSSIETGPDKEKVFHNYLYNYLAHLASAGCREQSTVKTFWKSDLDGFEYKYVAVDGNTRYRFKIGSSTGFIFSQAEKACFNDSSQHPDLIQRAIDCNFDRQNDITGLHAKLETELYRCLGVNPLTGVQMAENLGYGNNVTIPLCEGRRFVRRGSQINSGCSLASIADNSCGYSTPDVPFFNF